MARGDLTMNETIMAGQSDMSGLVHYGTVLVTGCGGDIGIGVGRILRMTNVCECLVGCDIKDNHPGHAFFDVCEKVPQAFAEDYFEKLTNLVQKYSVDLIILITEPELKVFCGKGVEGQWGNYPVIMPNSKALAVGLDKLATMRFLADNNLPVPWTVEVNAGPPLALPCMIKDRFGAGSRSVSLVKEWGLVDELVRDRPGAIWQEYLQPDDEEYTCGLFRSKTGEVRNVIFKRQLQGGLTGSGEVVENTEINNLLQRIAVAIKLTGSINVQLRYTVNGPFVFEINSRFSSTVVFRHLLGFQDLVWSLCESANISLPKYRNPKAGTKIYRVGQEVILP